MQFFQIRMSFENKVFFPFLFTVFPHLPEKFIFIISYFTHFTDVFIIIFNFFKQVCSQTVILEGIADVHTLR
jgi:hypothetical protein